MTKVDILLKTMTHEDYLGDTEGGVRGGRCPPLQDVGEGDEGVGGVESQGQDGVAVVVPVHHQPGALQPAVESQQGQGGHSRRGLDQQPVQLGEQGQAGEGSKIPPQ